MKLVIVAEALAELKAATTYYRQTGGAVLARTFADEAERALQRIAQTPEIGAPFRENYRRFVLHRFPYTLIYRQLPGTVRVLALAHQKRHPMYWTHRK